MITEFGAQRVHAFEPSPESYRLLRQTVIANGLEAKVCTYELALSDRDGDLPFISSSRHAGNSCVATDSSLSNSTVRATTLDAMAQRHAWDLANVALVWIDVQGYEAAVLAGASRIIAAGVPVLIEYWPSKLAETGTLDHINEIIATRFTSMIDFSRDHDPRPTSEVRLIPGYYRGKHKDGYTDLLLLPA